MSLRWHNHLHPHSQFRKNLHRKNVYFQQSRVFPIDSVEDKSLVIAELKIHFTFSTRWEKRALFEIRNCLIYVYLLNRFNLRVKMLGSRICEFSKTFQIHLFIRCASTFPIYFIRFILFWFLYFIYFFFFGAQLHSIEIMKYCYKICSKNVCKVSPATNIIRTISISHQKHGKQKSNDFLPEVHQHYEFIRRVARERKVTNSFLLKFRTTLIKYVIRLCLPHNSRAPLILYFIWAISLWDFIVAFVG